VGWSIECEGSVYWFLQDYESSVLMAARLDGGRARQIVRLTRAQGEAQQGENLAVFRGEIYCIVNHATTSSIGAQHIQLVRIRPERQNPLEVVRDFPPDASSQPAYSGFGQMGFDGGYLYFRLTEYQRGLWERITGDSAGARFTVGMFPVPLP
jgi:hypothetical protein